MDFVDVQVVHLRIAIRLNLVVYLDIVVNLSIDINLGVDDSSDEDWAAWGWCVILRTKPLAPVTAIGGRRSNVGLSVLFVRLRAKAVAGSGHVFRSRRRGWSHGEDRRVRTEGRMVRG